MKNPTKRSGAECDIGRKFVDKRVVSSFRDVRFDSLNRNEISIPQDRERTLRRLYAKGMQQSLVFQRTLSVHGRNFSRFVNMEAIQMARSKLSESDGSQVNKLWLDTGETHLNFLECGYPAAVHSAGSDASRRIQHWYSESRRRRFVWSIPRDSLLIKTVRLVLQSWRGVCSFSQTMRSIGAMKKVVWCTTFAPNNKVDQENDPLKSCSMAYTYDDITIT
jgi:hypothetical protein